MNPPRAGLDDVFFYAPKYTLDLRLLAEARSVNPDKFRVGLGQERMAVTPPDEDVVTLGANAALPVVERAGRDRISMIIFATESAVDQSKAAALHLHGLLDLPTRCRAFEMKQACYSATAAIQLSNAWIAQHPEQAVLVVASDIARYELRSPGEPTQGAGAVAMLLAAGGRILGWEPGSGLHADDVMDFWRPNYRTEALVDGPYSTRVYLECLLKSWAHYRDVTGRTLEAFDRFCYHLPFTRMAEKAHRRLVRDATGAEPGPEAIGEQVGNSLRYGRLTGNTYTASLYEGLVSLLDTDNADLTGKRIGFYSYGSGCMGEFFSGVVESGYRDAIRTDEHRKVLEDRTELEYQQYEDIFQLDVPADGGDHAFAQYRTGPFRLAGIAQHKRMYERVDT